MFGAFCSQSKGAISVGHGMYCLALSGWVAARIAGFARFAHRMRASVAGQVVVTLRKHPSEDAVTAAGTTG
jgi:hypothetical protein